MELFERAIEGNARLLKVDRLSAGGSDDEVARAFLLTFDVGRIVVAVDVARGQLRAEHLPVDQDAEASWSPANEDEPWWRIVGNPLTACAAEGSGVALQFRRSDENPRVVAVRVEEGLVRVAMEARALI